MESVCSEGLRLGIVSSTYLPVLGGLQFQLETQVHWIDQHYEFLRSKYHLESVVFFLPKAYKMEQERDFKYLAVEYFDFSMTPWGIFWGWYQLRALFKANNINISHAHNVGVDGMLTLWMPRGGKRVLTSHGQDIAHYPEFSFGLRKRLWGRLFVAISLKWADALIVASDVMRRVAALVFDPERTTVIPLLPDRTPADRSASVLREVEAPEVTERGVVFATLSGPREIKGHKNLVLAFSRILTHYPNAKLVIGAEGAYFEQIRSLVFELGITNSVVFPGFVSGEQKVSFFAEADVYVNTAIFEPFGLVYYEAAAAGVTIIASSESGATEIFRDRAEALVVNPHSVDSIAAAMLDACDPSLRLQLSAAAAEAVNRIDNSELMDQQFNVYAGLVRAV